MCELRTIHESSDPGPDYDAKAEVFVTKNGNHFSGGWKKSREWFDDLCDTICSPLGLKPGNVTWGNVCVKGKAFVGPLATAVAAGVVIAKIADADRNTSQLQALNGSEASVIVEDANVLCMHRVAVHLPLLYFGDFMRFLIRYLCPADGSAVRVRTCACLSACCSPIGRESRSRTRLLNVDSFLAHTCTWAGSSMIRHALAFGL